MRLFATSPGSWFSVDPQLLFMLPLWYAVFLLSLTCHEAAHAWAAKIGGDPTAYLGGQVSLNPLPHMQREMVGTILVPLVTFFLTQGWMMGWASAPYDPNWADRYPHRSAAMAAAGPAANLILAIIGLLAMKAGMAGDLWIPPESPRFDLLVQPIGGDKLMEALARLLSILFSLNLVLFVFNLFPVPPLDGGAIVGGLIPAMRAAYAQLYAMPFGAFIGIIVAWQLFDYVFQPVFGFALRLLW